MAKIFNALNQKWEEDPNAGLGSTSMKEENPATALADITKQSTPLMQQARTAGSQAAQQRGLLNSSIAVGESQKQAYNAAIPLAQQIGQQNAAANAAQRAYEYNTGLTSQKAQNDYGLANLEQGTKLQIAAAQAGAEQNKNYSAYLTDQIKAYQTQLGTIDTSNTMTAAAKEQAKANLRQTLDAAIKAGGEIYKSPSASVLTTNYKDAMAAIDTDTTMDNAAKDMARTAIRNNYTGQMAISQGISNSAANITWTPWQPNAPSKTTAAPADYTVSGTTYTAVWDGINAWKFVPKKSVDPTWVEPSSEQQKTIDAQRKAAEDQAALDRLKTLGIFGG